MQNKSFFVTTARGTEEMLVRELRTIQPDHPFKLGRAGVSFDGPLSLAYRICLWSRVASRVLMPIKTFGASHEDALYNGVRSIDWDAHIGPGKTIAVHGVTSRSALTNSKYIALKTKDAVVDMLRDKTGSRPNVELLEPDVLINLHLNKDQATVSIDLSGQSLHRRGLNRRNTMAPLKENLAAALLMMAGWPELAAQGAPLVDPMCGSGTLLIEAALMAMDVAPGMRRDRYGFDGWLGHDLEAWEQLQEEAYVREVEGRQRAVAIYGFDQAPVSIQSARRNVEHAGLGAAITLECKAFGAFEPPASPCEEAPRGLVITNPPYGERLGEAGELGPLYERLGDVFKRRFHGWTAAVLTGNKALAGRIGLKSSQRYPVFNGPIECRLMIFPLRDTPPTDKEGPLWRKPSADGEMLANRLRKNHKRLRKWARKNDVECYRLYDADIPEYNMAIDLYKESALIQEYQRPYSIDPRVAEQHLKDARLIVPELLGISESNIHLKVRRRQKPHEQYSKLAELGTYQRVQEGGLTFLVNLNDYLDTGLFLDQRLIRSMIRDMSKGKKFLNLFAYTCTASVYAAAGGASSTTSVDLSRNYLDWGWRNLNANNFEGVHKHRLVREDCKTFLNEDRGRYDLIYAAPPTFSRSKRADTFDVQYDHVGLIQACMRHLKPDGVLLFSNPFRDFRIDAEALSGLKLEDITRATMPRDFTRNPTFSAWRITR